MLACYLRYSPRPSGVSESNETQLERIKAWAASQGLEVTHVFRDENKSGGTQVGRMGLADALAEVCKAKGTLVVYSLSRLARNTRDALEISERLREAGANLVLLDLGLDTRTPLGKCAFTILSAVAELEREQISQRTSDALQRKRRNGERVSRFAPYGYKINGKLLELEPEEQKTVSLIKYYWKSGYNEAQISSKLNKQKKRQRHGKAWDKDAIKNIIRGLDKAHRIVVQSQHAVSGVDSEHAASVEEKGLSGADGIVLSSIADASPDRPGISGP